MRIEDRQGQPIEEATVTLDDFELVDLLEGLADVVEGQRTHMHFHQAGGPQLVVQHASRTGPDPIGASMDWWVGPLVLSGVLFVIVGAVTVARWAIGLAL
ncbi:MAG: hypothetical protein H0U16_12860 [Actinobacteria bacterium]|nr:hypothetical protein [Actinomycetota bacterium]